MEQVGNFGNSQVGMEEQPFDFEQLFGFDDLGGAFSGQLPDSLGQMVGRDANQPGIVAQQQVSLEIFFDQMEESFDNDLSLPVVFEQLMGRIPCCTGGQNKIQDRAEHFGGGFPGLIDFMDALPEQQLQKTDVVLAGKQQWWIVLVNGIKEGKFNQAVLVASVELVKISGEDEDKTIYIE